MSHYFQQSLPNQRSSTSCMDNCSSLLIYLSATIFGLLHLFSSHQLERSFNNWNLKDVIPLFNPHPPMAHSVKRSLSHKLAPLPLWSYLLPSSPQFILLPTQRPSCPSANMPEPLHLLFLLPEVSFLLMFTRLIPPSFCSNITLSRKFYPILNVQLYPVVPVFLILIPYLIFSHNIYCFLIYIRLTY